MKKNPTKTVSEKRSVPSPNEHVEKELSQSAEEKRLLSQYSADSLITTTVRTTNPTSKSSSKKARLEVLAQYTFSEEEEEQAKKPAAKKPRNKTKLVAEKKEAKNKTEVAPEDDIEDPEEQDPKFRIVRQPRRADPQLTLTQYWPDNSSRIDDRF